MKPKAPKTRSVAMPKIEQAAILGTCCELVWQIAIHEIDAGRAAPDPITQIKAAADKLARGVAKFRSLAEFEQAITEGKA